MKKIFKALGPSVVEKKFVADMAPPLDGWYESQKDAMDMFVHDKPKKRRAKKASLEVVDDDDS